MPYEVIFTKMVEAQIAELEAYLAERFYPGDAKRYVRRLVDECLSLGSSPHRGRRRDDLRAGIRAIGFERRAAIYFKATEGRVMILSVRYGGQEATGDELDEG